MGDAVKNAAAFFDSIRFSLFGNRLSQSQVEGINAILRSCQRNGVTDNRHVANILAQVFHETGGRMVPVREAFGTSDAETIRKLEAAWAAGRLPWVREPYWRSGFFGRGPIQLTHESNYRKMGAALGVDLVGNRSKALDPEIGADIAVVGMRDGMFREGHSLGRYFNRGTDDPEGARRIVNGQDGTDAKVARYHRKFLAAIRAAGGITDGHYAPPPPDVEPIPETPSTGRKTGWSAGIAGAVAAVATAFAGIGPEIIVIGVFVAGAGVLLWKREKIKDWWAKRKS